MSSHGASSDMTSRPRYALPASRYPLRTVDLGFLSSPETWIALLTLTALEIVLGIDNIVFISIMAGKLPPEQRGQAYALGLGAAMVMRILLLFSISFIVGLTAPLFTLPFFEREVSG